MSIFCRMSGKGKGIFSTSLCEGYGMFFGMTQDTGILVINNVFLFCGAQFCCTSLPQHGLLKAIKNNMS